MKHPPTVNQINLAQKIKLLSAECITAGEESLAACLVICATSVLVGEMKPLEELMESQLTNLENVLKTMNTK